VIRTSAEVVTDQSHRGVRALISDRTGNGWLDGNESMLGHALRIVIPQLPGSR
jgi:hypothetical protein